MKILLLIFSLFLLSLFQITTPKPLIAKKVVTAINCGSSTGAKSSLGFTYQAVNTLLTIFRLL